MAICIDRCVCFNVPFERLVQIAASTGCKTIEALQEQVEFKSLASRQGFGAPGMGAEMEVKVHRGP
jgi:hypothetical protein